jgi:hypothetical protein
MEMGHEAPKHTSIIISKILMFIPSAMKAGKQPQIT